MTRDTYLLPVIRTTEKVGRGTTDDIAHRHVVYYSTDGEKLAETCDVEECGRA